MGSGASQPLSTDSVHVVIVGGGYGGIYCALDLKKNGVPFTLIDPKDFFHHNVGALRASVTKDYASKTMIDYQTTFGDQFVQGQVMDIDLKERTVTLDTARTITFTHLVLATGSQGPFPGRIVTKEAAKAVLDYENTVQEVTKAKSIVIIGGGAVGIELAGEIKDVFPDKEVTLIHSREQLLSNVKLGPKLQENAKYQLENVGVKVVLGHRVVNLKYLTFDKTGEEQTVQDENGGEYKGDLIFSCTGLKPDTSLLSKTFAESEFNEEGRLIVSSSLEMPGHASVFAIGDCNNTGLEKMAAHAQEQGQVVAENIIRAVQEKEFKTYKPSFEGMFVTVGKCRGAAVVNGWNLPSVACGVVKGKSLFTDRYWKAMGQTMPN